MPARDKAFQRRLEAAVADPNLSTALTRALSTFRERRDEAFRELDFEGMRADLRQRKESAIANLPALIDRFTAEAEAVGAVVHRAATAEDACRIVGDLATERGVTLAVKSKSMATEEIHLNAHLESVGVRAVESDLGEWIIQLAGETPSHLIAPAIHKTREQVADLLSAATGETVPADVQALVGVARRELRQTFIDAGMGISGANAAIAETGTLMIVSNEGNGRLVTTLPPVHVAILGVEKIVPALEDATKILQLLPRSGTAQKITSYVSFITGPSRSADIELIPSIGVHGPKELHIVLLDNGRMAAREDAEMLDTLYCIRCGACSNVCPPYQIVGGHLFGHIYTGPIGLPLTALHHGLGAVADPQSLCVSCNACEIVCPVAIPIPRLILNVRERVTESMGLPAVKEMGLTRWADPARGNRWGKLAAWGASLLSDDDGYVRSIPLQGKLTKGRHLPAPARKPLRERVRHLHGTASHGSAPPAPLFPGSTVAGQTIAYFPGCMTDRLMPEMGEAVIRVFEACGCRVVFPPDQHCCGLVALNVGDRDRGRVMAEQTIRALEAVEADWIVTNSTSCYAAMVDDYRHLFRHDPDWLRRVEALDRKLVESVTFLVDVARVERPPGLHANGPIVTYHDACQSHNALKIRDAPRRLIEDVLGLEIREMRESSVCCGFGGSFAADYPEVSTAILSRKLESAAETGARVIVADNPGCLMQIRGGLHARGSSTRALHLLELIDERLRILREPRL